MTDTLTLQLMQERIGDRYALERELGRGGMGAVWLARDLRLDRPVALKVLHDRIAIDPVARERFIREARIAARLAHPHIVPVFGVEEHGAATLLVMAMIDGETLGARIRRRGPLLPAEVERLVREVGWALGYAHSHDVIHRDLTPENILIERDTGRALLVDFGLAQFRSDETQLTMGTPGYIAPEVIRGEPATAAADLYAMGATAWFALTGSPPYSGDTASEILAKHLVQPLPDLPVVAQGASRRMVDALRACLEKDAEARPADVAAMLARLDRAPPPVGIAPPLQEWFTRWERIRVGYAIATPALAVQLLILMEAYLDRGGDAFRFLAALSWILTTAIVPAAVQLISEVAALRRLATRGFGIGDIRAAWEHWTDRLRTEYRREGLPPLAGRVILDLTVVGVVTIVVGFILAATVMPMIVAPSEMGWNVFALMSLGSWVFLGTAAGLSINFLSPGMRLNPDGPLRRLARRFWRGPVAALMARLSTSGVSTTALPSTTVHRNTELVLGLAIDTLWKALPHDQRAPHGDIPAIGSALQRGAEELRATGQALAEAQSRIPQEHPEWQRIEMLVGEINDRHRETVGRLESLRLQLLRSVAARSVTTDMAAEIAAARETEQALIFGLAGANEARRALGRPPRREPLAHTPTPSPALP